MNRYSWCVFTLVSFVLTAAPAGPAGAYEVEGDSAGNTVYVLLWNAHPTAVFDSISISETLPAFVSQATASIIPAAVPAHGSDLAAVDFDVAAGATLGATGDLTITVSGSTSGQPIDLVLTVPLEVVATAPVAQGVVGQGVPAPDPGGTDSDGDGVTDALEIAFGSDPSDASSLPGSLSPPPPGPIPLLEDLGFMGLIVLLLGSGTWLAGRRRRDSGIT